MSNTYLTPKQLSDRWENNISVKTLANWRCDPSGKGPSFRRFGNKIFYPLSAVEAYELANHFGSTSEYTFTSLPPSSGALTRSSPGAAPLPATDEGQPRAALSNHGHRATLTVAANGTRRRRSRRGLGGAWWPLKLRLSGSILRVRRRG